MRNKGVLLIFSLIIFALSVKVLLLLPVPIAKYIITIVILSISIVIFVIYIIYTIMRLRAGEQLLEIKNEGKKWGLILTGIIFTIISIYLFYKELIYGKTDLYSISSDIFRLASSSYFIFLGLLGVYIHENGVVINGSFIAWENILSYYWVRDDHENITFETSKRFILPNKLNISIPNRYSDQTNKLLIQYLGAPTRRCRRLGQGSAGERWNAVLGFLLKY